MYVHFIWYLPQETLEGKLGPSSQFPDCVINMEVLCQPCCLLYTPYPPIIHGCVPTMTTKGYFKSYEHVTFPSNGSRGSPVQFIFTFACTLRQGSDRFACCQHWKWTCYVQNLSQYYMDAICTAAILHWMATNTHGLSWRWPSSDLRWPRAPHWCPQLLSSHRAWCELLPLRIHHSTLYISYKVSPFTWVELGWRPYANDCFLSFQRAVACVKCINFRDEGSINVALAWFIE